MFSESVIKDWVVIGLASVAFILVLKFMLLHALGKFAPAGLKSAIAAV